MKYHYLIGKVSNTFKFENDLLNCMQMKYYVTTGEDITTRRGISTFSQYVIWVQQCCH